MAEQWEQRARKVEAKHARMPKHGKALAVVYANAIRRRAAAAARRKPADRRGAPPPESIRSAA